jgi:hypothetical protein
MPLHRQSGITAITGDKSNALAAVMTLVGDATTRAAVLADADQNPARFPVSIGSMYLASSGKVYVKITQSTPPASTDWQRVTTTAVD